MSLCPVCATPLLCAGYPCPACKRRRLNAYRRAVRRANPDRWRTYRRTSRERQREQDAAWQAATEAEGRATRR